MKDIPDNYFDLAIVDPPYGIGNFNSSKTKHKAVKWNDSIPDETYFTELKRVSKNRIIWGANYYTNLIGGRIIHDKMDGGRLKQTKSMSEMDIAYQSFNNLIRCFRYAWKGNVQGNKIVWSEKKLHPCEKPIALYKWLLTNYAKPGDKLFDSHSGSGSFRIAAYDMGFDLISCELDADYCSDNEARYQKHIQQMDLFKPKEIQQKIYRQGEL